MPLFYFHLREDGTIVVDEEGIELPDLSAAREEAIAGARSILSDEAKKGRLPLSFRVEVTDEAGDTVMSLIFADAVAIL